MCVRHALGVIYTSVVGSRHPLETNDNNPTPNDHCWLSHLEVIKTGRWWTIPILKDYTFPHQNVGWEQQWFKQWRTLRTVGFTWELVSRLIIIILVVQCSRVSVDRCEIFGRNCLGRREGGDWRLQIRQGSEWSEGMGKAPCMQSILIASW